MYIHIHTSTHTCKIRVHACKYLHTHIQTQCADMSTYIYPLELLTFYAEEESAMRRNLCERRLWCAPESARKDGLGVSGI